MINVLLPEAPGFPTPGIGKRKPHGHGLLHAAAQPHLAPKAKPITAGPGHDQLDLTVHLAAIEVAQTGLDLESAVATFEAWFEPEPIDRDGSHILEPDRLPQAERNLGPVGLGQARVGRRGVRLEVAVVEEAHDVALLFRLRFDR